MKLEVRALGGLVSIPLTTVVGFRGPRLRLIRGGDSSVTVNWHIVLIYLVALEV